MKNKALKYLGKYIVTPIALVLASPIIILGILCKGAYMAFMTGWSKKV